MFRALLKKELLSNLLDLKFVVISGIASVFAAMRCGQLHNGEVSRTLENQTRLVHGRPAWDEGDGPAVYSERPGHESVGRSGTV